MTARNLPGAMTNALMGLALVALLVPAVAVADAVDLAPEGLKPVGVEVAAVEYQGRKAVAVTGKPDATERLAVVPGVVFGDGTIEVELAGAPAATAGRGARGFVGIAFRVQDDPAHFECFYLRPTNGRAEDQLRRNHSAQYIGHPEYPWHRLRKETPGKYESYVDLVPGEWTKVKVVVSGKDARLFVHGAEQPTLIVRDLKLDAETGAVALWIGPGTVAHFANLRVSR